MDIEITSEPLTYRRGARVSFFRDLAIMRAGSDGSGEAAERIERHEREISDVLAAREKRAADRLTAEGIVTESRANPNRLAGQGGSFSPPLWLLDQAASSVRPARTLSAMMPGFDLPSGVGVVNLPRLGTGTQMTWTGDGTAATDRDIIDYSVTSPVATIAGNADMALQMLEQSPPGDYLDHILFQDMLRSYSGHLEAQLAYGNGSPAPNGQLMGVLNVPSGPGGAVSVTYMDVSPTAAKLYPYWGQLAAQIGDARFMPPEVWLMRTARWAWIGTGEDGQGMPLATPSHTPPPPIPYLLDDDRATAVSAFLGWPIYPWDVIPATLNSGLLTGGTQDAIVGCRPSDMLLLESPFKTSVFLEVLSGTLTARLQARSYVAAFVARQPTGIGTLTGSGLVVQSGY